MVRFKYCTYFIAYMIAKLKRLGLTDGEARVYLAMLKTGSSNL